MAWLNRRTFFQTNATLVASAMAGKAAGAEEAGSGKAQCDKRELTEKPNPIITGPSQAQDIARFASRARYEDLTAERRERLKVDVLDSLACSIGAVGAPPIEAYCGPALKRLGSKVVGGAPISGRRLPLLSSLPAKPRSPGFGPLVMPRIVALS